MCFLRFKDILNALFNIFKYLNNVSNSYSVKQKFANIINHASFNSLFVTRKVIADGPYKLSLPKE